MCDFDKNSNLDARQEALNRLHYARELKVKAKRKLAAAEQHRADVIAEMALHGVTPETVGPVIANLQTEIQMQIRKMGGDVQRTS